MTLFTRLSGVLLSMMLAGTAMAQDKPDAPRLSPQTKMYLYETAKPGYDGAMLPDYIYRELPGGRYIAALVKVTPALNVAQLEHLGARIGTRAGNIWMVQIPVQSVKAFTSIKGLDYVQLDEPVQPLMDSVRKMTRVDSVHQGTGLPMPLQGKDVVMGIIDGGFDYTHPTFMDITGNRFRIKQVWEEETTGTPPAGYAYGHEMTDSTAIRTKGWDSTKVLSHGTHVGGIAGGSGYGSPNNGTEFRGIAYESDLVMVGIASRPGTAMNTGLTNMVDGLNYIFTYAAAKGKPAVANLSWGINTGPHDGTSLFSQAVDNLTGPGKILVLSAGNEGAQNLHLQKNFSATDTLVHTFLSFTAGSDSNTVDMWGETGQSFCAGFSLYNAANTEVSNTGFICLDDLVHSTYLVGTGGDTCWFTITTSTAEFNQKPRIYVKVRNKTADKVAIHVSGHGGKIHLWNKEAFSSNGFNWATNGNVISTISDMATTPSAIAVGAYASKLSFTNISGDPLSYSGTPKALAFFSSRGPAIDGTVQPFITAPGHTVVSAVSSFDSTFIPTGSGYSSAISSYLDPVSGKDYLYGAFSGTSMSSPVVAGVVGLMLQLDPTLSPAQVKAIIKETAIRDSYTGNIPATGSNTWGFGRINAYAAIKKMAALTSITPVNSNTPECFLYPNPGTGSFTLAYQSARPEKLLVQVYNLSGVLVQTATYQTVEGWNNYALNLQALSKGTYITRISGKQASQAIKTVIR